MLWLTMDIMTTDEYGDQPWDMASDKDFETASTMLKKG